MTTMGTVKSKKGVFETAPPSSGKNVLTLDLLQVELTCFDELLIKGSSKKTLGDLKLGNLDTLFYSWAMGFKIPHLSVPSCFQLRSDSPFTSAQKTSMEDTGNAKGV